ncbi:MAG: hypothetical protein JO300_03150 [Silvibacterium sp.]|nr:hypothetical protein [Silvibacterium sp.]MBV8437941.1 hypothetical protein [Silvibacterium sp.]
MRDDSVNCEALQRALREGREVTREQSAHVDGCDACMDVWLTTTLENKPEVAIPADFPARVAAKLPDRPNHRAAVRRPRYWGLATAFVIVTVVLVVCFSNLTPLNSWIEVLFITLVTIEVAGLALWLGPRWSG